MAHAIEDDLGHRFLPAPVVARFVEDRGGQAVDGAGQVLARSGEAERARGGVRPADERDRRVERACIVGIDRLKLDGLDGGQFGTLDNALGGADLSRDLRWNVRRIGGDQQG